MNNNLLEADLFFISIIIPVYNVEDYLNECLESITLQNFVNYEIILINDGSKDNSGLICDNFGKINSNVRVVHKENEGTASARNIGIKMARGQFLWFVDSDDLVHKNSLRILHDEIANNHGVDVCNFNKINYVETNKKLINDNLLYDKKKYYNVVENFNIDIPSSVCYSIFRRKFILEKEIFFNEKNHFEDEFFNIQLYLNFQFKILLLDKPLYIYRQYRENSKTSSVSSDQLFLKCISMIALSDYISSIPKTKTNLHLIKYRKKYYAEMGLSYLITHIKINNGSDSQSLLKLFIDKIKYVPIRGKILKRTQIPRILYNINLRLFLYYCNLID